MIVPCQSFEARSGGERPSTVRSEMSQSGSMFRKEYPSFEILGPILAGEVPGFYLPQHEDRAPQQVAANNTAFPPQRARL